MAEQKSSGPSAAALLGELKTFIARLSVVLAFARRQLDEAA